MMESREFEIAVQRGYEQLPEWVRQKIKNVALLVEDEPSIGDRAAQKLTHDETLFGLYKGIPLSLRGVEYGVGETYPDTITIYRKPIIKASGGNATRISQIVADTVWHEFAHHFGLTEHEVRAREKQRGIVY